MDTRVQSEHSSRSRISVWGQLAVTRVRLMASYFKNWMYEDDSCADFGGGDGFVAEEFKAESTIPMIVVDAVPDRIEAARAHGLRAIEADLCAIPLDDGTIDWGFCSHTLEHVDDPRRALAELFRVAGRAIFFVLPIEDAKAAAANPAHVTHFEKPEGWRDLIEAAGFIVADWWHVADPPFDAIYIAFKPDFFNGEWIAPIQVTE